MEFAEAHFEDINIHINTLINTAEESIKICVAWITINEYIDCLREAKKRNVRIELICNKDRLSEIVPEELFNEFYSINSYLNYGLMHNKFCIIDDKVLITGSFNWSKNALNHFENIIILKNNFHVIKKYLHEFEDLKKISTEYQSYLSEKYNYLSESNRCSEYRCNSKTINILVTAYNNESSTVRFSIWEICRKNQHAHLLTKYEEEDFGNYQEVEIDDNQSYSKEIMQREFNEERYNIDRHYLRKLQGYDIHALAYIQITNPNYIIKYDEQEEYEVQVYWRNILFRKLIPDTIHDESIIEWGL